MIIHSGDYCRLNRSSNEKPDDFLFPPNFHMTNTFEKKPQTTQTLGKACRGHVLPQSVFEKY